MIEKYVSEIINEDYFEVEINGKKINVAQPTTATLIEVSKFIGQLPNLNIDENRNLTLEALRVARDCEFVGELIATLILGKKRLRAQKKWQKDKKKELARILLEELTPKELNRLGNEILSKMDIAFFLGFIISLQEVNLTKPTKTTVSGQ